MTITGGCLCGAVRYAIKAEPVAVRVCWCRDCQKVGAGSGTVNVFFPSEALRLDGALADYVNRADSGNVMHRRFCPACGTPVTTQSEARMHLVGVRAGTLDDPGAIRPELTIWTASAPEWAPIDPALPRTEGQPPPPQVSAKG
jgi:hypothetical protein